MFQLIFLLQLLCTSRALLGFDCGGQHLNITSVSLLDVGECKLPHKNLNISEVYIQLLQLSDYKHTQVIQCKVEISRTIYYCGMHSHISIVRGSRAEYIHEVDYSQCQGMIKNGAFSLGTGMKFGKLLVNQTTSHPLTIAGLTHHNGKCVGTQYSDIYGTWEDVVVEGLARVSLKTSYVPVKLDSGKIILKSGTVCTLSEGTCIDSEDGNTFWEPMPTTSCNLHQYDVLYEGLASKTTEENVHKGPTVYSLTTQDITFALTKTREQPLCGYTLLRTEHPKLFILEARKGDTFATKGTISIDNLDIFSYMNSKFVYVEKHIRQQMTTLYHNVIQQKCKLEQDVITNTLSFATLQPDEFAYRVMKGPGYMAVTSGEAVHIIKCIPIDAILRKTKECYSELPVTIRNTSLFLTPKSRILTKFGTQKECSFELPTLYRIEDTWIQLTPEPQVRQLPPQRLHPQTALEWKYLTPGPLAVSGIYTETDIEKLRDHIMFPAEKPAVLNFVARGMTGQTGSSGDVSLYNLLDEKSLQKIADNAASRIWKGFVTFGSATAGVFGIFLIIRIIKLTIDTAIHGYALHMAYGCSLHLLGAIWSSLTHLLLHLARPPIRRRTPENPEAPSAPEDVHQSRRSSLILANELLKNKIVNTNLTGQGPIIYSDLRERLGEMRTSQENVEHIPPAKEENVPK